MKNVLHIFYFTIRADKIEKSNIPIAKNQKNQLTQNYELIDVLIYNNKSNNNYVIMYRWNILT